jgi:hypothetical protein
LGAPESLLDKALFDAEISFFQAAVFIIIAYISGFITCTVANLLLSLINKIIQPFLPKHNGSITKSLKYTIVRQKSRENQKYIELWNTLKNFCANLALVILIIAFIFLKKFNSFTWIYFLVSLFIVVILFIRAREYGNWARSDLNNAYDVFK